mmetsp:Transcript_54204/g.129146  ORF Transcript_54204/g.129146 Transcript_54204/m.129146 type:complete len:592 (-) Transcript_54204:75-1850(-)
MGAAPSCGCSSVCEKDRERNTVVESVNVVCHKSSSEMSMSTRSLSVVSDFPVYCLPMEDFMQLERMQAHEDLFDQLIEPCDESIVHFISHEWLGFQNPDPAGTQLRRMQMIFRAFIAGEAHKFFREEDWRAFLHGVSAGTGTSLRNLEKQLAGRVCHSAEDVAEHARTGSVWLDYHSIPQGPNKGEDFVKAVNGIPHYVERCDYFWICAPRAIHAELQQPRDFSTWRSRGWCRLEDTVNFLSRNLKMPLVVTCQPHVTTFGLFDAMQPYFGRPERSVFNGRFTCCQLNHEIKEPDGTIREIDCDKYTLAPMLRKCFYNFLTKDSDGIQLFRINLLRDIARTIFAGLEEEEEMWKPDPDETLEEALDRIGFAHLDDTDELGWTPLIWLVIVADFTLIRQVCKARPDLLLQRPSHGFTILMRAVHMQPSRFSELLELHPKDSIDYIVNAASLAGHTALDRAAKNGFCENVATLLKAKANIEAVRKDNGATPLLSAAEAHYPCCCRTLLKHKADITAIDDKGRTALHLAVDPLSILYNQEQGCSLEVITILLEARADVTAQDNRGMTALDLAEELKLEPEYGLSLLRKWVNVDP